MRKIDELSDPTSCLSRAEMDERVFVLLERDVCAPEVIQRWADARVREGKNLETDEQIVEARETAVEMIKGRHVITDRLARRLEERKGVEVEKGVER